MLIPRRRDCRANKENQAMKTVTRDTLKALIENDAVTVVEALPLEYYRKAHLPGARHLPHDAVEQLAAQVLPDRAAPIVVYCANAECANSGIAAGALERLGYRDVSVYVEGKKDWLEAGYPVEARRAA
jgi:rhodanese-related sulfurtransferase